MLKIYTLIHDFSLSTPVNVNGVSMEIVFRGGCKALNQNGEFSTTDLQIQQALEGSPGFNRTYKLSKSFPTTEDEGKDSTDSLSEDEGKELGGDLTNDVQKTCKTVNEAIDWLVGLGQKKMDVNTSSKAIDVAKSLGYVLIFEKVKSE